MLVCRSSLPCPADRWIRTREQRSHDQYSAVYFTSEETLAHRSLEHTQLTSLKSCFIPCCGELFSFSLDYKRQLCWHAEKHCWGAFQKISELLHVHLSHSNNRTVKQQDCWTTFYVLKITSTCENETGPPVNRADNNEHCGDNIVMIFLMSENSVKVPKWIRS